MPTGRGNTTSQFITFNIEVRTPIASHMGPLTILWGDSMLEGNEKCILDNYMANTGKVNSKAIIATRGMYFHREIAAMAVTNFTANSDRYDLSGLFTIAWRTLR